MTTLRQAVREQGGIRSYRNGDLREELRAVPLCCKRRAGLPLDEMRDTLGRQGFNFESESEFLEALAGEHVTPDPKGYDAPDPADVWPSIWGWMAAAMTTVRERAERGEEFNAARALREYAADVLATCYGSREEACRVLRVSPAELEGLLTDEAPF